MEYKIGKMRKGQSYSTIAILALIGILILSIWSYSQLATGSRYSSTITQREPQDIAVSNLEVAKQFVTQNLKYSAQTAALDVASNGGTQFGSTYWYCDSQPNAPSLDEVDYALSTGSLNSLNAYIATVPNSDLAKQGIQITPYTCAGLYDNGHSACTQQDSSTCESFQASGTQGGNIQITSPAQVQYNGPISSDISPNRFYWMYYKLYDDTQNNGFLRAIAAGLRDACPTTTSSPTDRLQFALDNVCTHYENLLAEPDGTKYVKCTMQVLCADTANPVACINTPCQRPALSQPLCWKTASQSALNIGKSLNNFVSGLGGQAAQAQASSGVYAGIRVKVTLTDNKFNIPSSNGLQPLVWNIWAETQVSNQDCRPIN